MPDQDRLSYRRQDAYGGFNTNRLPPHGIEVRGFPDSRLDGGHYLFLELGRTLSQARVIYKIHPDGEVYFLAPFGMKFGWLLGEVARVYWLLQREIPPIQQSLNGTEKEVQR